MTPTRTPIADELRCIAVSKTTGRRCAKAAATGTTVCNSHGAAAPQVARKVQHAKVRAGLARFVTPIAADDWEANPINSFEMEFRRTIAAIRYCEEKIAQLQEEELVWGQTKEEEVGASEFEGVNTTSEAKLNQWEVKRFAERQHLTDLHKIWINAKLDIKKLELERSYVDALEDTMRAIIAKLGRDPRDPEVRNIVRQELAALGPANPAERHTA